MKITVLQNKSGVTILEGVIALGLLALIMAGAFGVLLSSSRATSNPDMKEEMLLAVESAQEQLKAYAAYITTSSLGTKMSPYQPTSLKGIDYSNGLCGSSTHTDSNPLGSGGHDIKCLLPLICEPTNSTFTYNVQQINDYELWPYWFGAKGKWEGFWNPQMYESEGSTPIVQRDSKIYGDSPGGSYLAVLEVPLYEIKFEMKCNGYEL